MRQPGGDRRHRAYELPQPTQSTSTFLLRLPANFSGDIGGRKDAFKSAGGARCLVAGATTVMFAGPDALRGLCGSDGRRSAPTARCLFSHWGSAGPGRDGGRRYRSPSTAGASSPAPRCSFGTTAARSVTYVSALLVLAVTDASRRRASD